MPLGTLFIDPEWYKTAEGKDKFLALLNKDKETRRVFGMLEKPVFPSGVTPEVFEYKLFMSGKCGIGKTAAIAKLTANAIPTSHCETPGIQVSTTYWPAKLTEHNRVILFKLKFWEAGDNASKTFDYILPACKQHMDAVIFLFSFTDKSSFNDLPQHMTRVLNADENVSKFVFGTKLDLQTDCEVPLRDVTEFEVQWRLKVLSLGNLFRTGNDVEDIAPIMNFICDQLWQRDKMLVQQPTS